MSWICLSSASLKDALIPTSPEFLWEQDYSAWEALIQKSAAVPLLVSTLTNHIPATSTPFFKHLRSVHLYTLILPNARLSFHLASIKKNYLNTGKGYKNIVAGFLVYKNSF